jgi:hypothetical protein
MGTGDNENGTYELSYCQLASTASHFKEYKWQIFQLGKVKLSLCLNKYHAMMTYPLLN